MVLKHHLPLPELSLLSILSQRHNSNPVYFDVHVLSHEVFPPTSLAAEAEHVSCSCKLNGWDLGSSPSGTLGTIADRLASSDKAATTFVASWMASLSVCNDTIGHIPSATDVVAAGPEL